MTPARVAGFDVHNALRLTITASGEIQAGIQLVNPVTQIGLAAKHPRGIRARREPEFRPEPGLPNPAPGVPARPWKTETINIQNGPDSQASSNPEFTTRQLVAVKGQVRGSSATDAVVAGIPTGFHEPQFSLISTPIPSMLVLHDQKSIPIDACMTITCRQCA